MCLSILFSCSKTDVVPEETGDIFKIDNVVFKLQVAGFDNYVSTSCTGKATGGFYANSESTGGSTNTTAELLIYNLSNFEGDVIMEPVSNSNCSPQCYILLRSSKGNAFIKPSKGTTINLSKSKRTFSMRNAKFEDSGTTFTVSIAGKTI
jgi:hypothetical protein